MGKGDRYGKWGSKKDWGQAHHLYTKDWGVSHELGSKEDHSWSFRNPETGAIRWIHGTSFEDAQRLAKTLGLRRTRRRGFKGMDGE